MVCLRSRTSSTGSASTEHRPRASVLDVGLQGLAADERHDVCMVFGLCPLAFFRGIISTNAGPEKRVLE